MNCARTNGKRWRDRLLPAWVVSMILAGIFCNQRMADAAKEAETQQRTQAPGEVIATMKEIPAWEVGERARGTFLDGSYGSVQEQKQGGCTYPDFKSETPLYGQVHFQSVAGNAGSSPTFFLALDHSEGKADVYDLLYFDENADRNLTNDPPHRARQDLPEALARKSLSIREQVWFEPVKLTFDFGPAGPHPVEMMPRLWVYTSGSKMLNFVPTTVRTGTFAIAGNTYRAFLGYQHWISGRLDQPGTALLLAPESGAPSMWWGADELRATHLLGRRYYRFSCTPVGDQLFARPYDGKLGVFEVGAGGRDVEKLEMDGSLYSKETAVAVGNTVGKEWPEPTRRCEIPVGDYYPAIMHISLDSIRLTVSNNYHTDARGRPPDRRETVAGITIREDKPYVLDFSNKPAVVFEQPKEDRRIRPGEELKVEAVLVDPILDIMIRGLDDTSATVKETYKDPDGTERTLQRPKSLDPKVVIKRANGEIVAEGIMPFG